jgi:UDP-N-acetylglucosamine acyltransferase
MASKIHPTVIIDKSSQIGQNVEIGPYSLIGPECVIGDDCVIGSSVAIHKWTELGPGVRVWHGASIGGDPQDLKYKGQRSRVVIGARTVVREYATINLSTTEGQTTAIGQNCLLMAYSHVAHECIVGNNVILANSVNLAGHVTVEDFAIIGGLTPVHQFCRVGRHSIVGGASAVRMDVVPFIKAAGDPLKPYGLNSVGLSRRGFTEEQKKRLNQAYRITFRSGLPTAQALARIREELEQAPEVLQFVEFIEKSERGITR